MVNEWQIRVGEFTYGVTDDPLFIGHVNQPNFGSNLRLEKALTMAILVCKLPLIVIVAP